MNRPVFTHRPQALAASASISTSTSTSTSAKHQGQGQGQGLDDDEFKEAFSEECPEGDEHDGQTMEWARQEKAKAMWAEPEAR